MTDYKVNFQDLKAKVGIDDVAYALGYRLDRKAGVGRYMELVLGDGKEKRDALVICHPQDKASQRFFRRDGSKGDVVTLIRENLNAFNVSGKDEWQKIAKVLNRFPGARPFGCFDNDLPGRNYGLRMMALVENIPLKINRTRDNLEVEANGRSFRLDPERPFQVQVKEHLSVRYDMGQWLPPKAFKDWNDCLLNKPMEVRLHPTKQDQINNLAERRNAGPKL